MNFFCLKHFSDGVCVQSIEHPGCVWDTKFMENGDIVTACSDGIARIWTVNQDYFADQLELDLYTSQLSQYKSSRYGFLWAVIVHLLLPFHQLLLSVHTVNFLTLVFSLKNVVHLSSVNN